MSALGPEKGPVLVVDDDADVREALALALGTMGYAVVTAADGEECLARMRGGEPPRVVLLDLMMPGMNGWEVCAELSRDPTLAHIPIIVLTGNAPAEAAILAASELLRKPVPLSTLVEVIDRHLAVHHLPVSPSVLSSNGARTPNEAEDRRDDRKNEE